MSPDSRLAEIITALEAVGLDCLIMGGHAVRFYGLDRNTADYDLHLAPSCWDDLPLKLSRTVLFAGKPLIEGPSWRPDAFRRCRWAPWRAGAKSGSNSGVAITYFPLLGSFSPGVKRVRTEVGCWRSFHFLT